MRTLLQFMSEFSASKDTFTLMAEFQEEIDDLAKSREYHKEEHYKLKDQVEKLQQELKKRPPVETVQHNLNVQQQVNNKLQQENQELKTLNNHFNDTILQFHEEIKELKEARDTLVAVLETKTQSRIFYKGSPDTDWIPLGTGHVTLEFKTASSIQGSDQPLKSDPETVIIDDPEYTSHSVRKLESKTKEELVKFCTRQAHELTKLNKLWLEKRNAYVKLEHKHNEIIKHRDELATSVGLLSDKVHKLQVQIVEFKKAQVNDSANYTKQIKDLEENKTMITALYQNQVNTIKKQNQILNKTRKLLTTIDEVISEADA